MRRIGVEQALDELLRRSPLPDQRVGEQRLARVDRVAAECGREGEPLVRRDVLDEPEQLRRERRLGEGNGDAVASIRAGTSTTSSSASPAIVPSLRMSTSWTSPEPETSEATRPVAASL